MTQASRPQADNLNNGYIDAGPYTRDEWAERVYAAHTGDLATTDERGQLRGVVPTFKSMLAVSNPAGVTIRVASGAGMSAGSYLFNDADVDFTPSTPAADRIDRVVIVENNTNAAYNTNLEFPTDLTDYAGLGSVPAYTARLAILTGIAGGAARPLVQTSNYWMVELAQYTISNVPAVSLLTDYREFTDAETVVGCLATENDEIQAALVLGVEVNDGAGADGLGVGITARLENDNGDTETAGQVAFRWTDATNGSEDARYELRLSAGNAQNLSAVINAPTAASADGNARGARAVDLQGFRGLATQVASGEGAAIGGGSSNTASGSASTVSGGASGLASGDQATVGGGQSNQATDTAATVAGGRFCEATDRAATVGGGSVCKANGEYSTVPGGENNIADGDYSLAAGRRALTGANDGVFIWADSENADFTADRADQFKVRASGGTHLVQNNNAAALPVLRLEQIDQDESFIDFVGTSAADQTKSISTAPGAGNVVGPKDRAAAEDAWSFVGMVKVEINGTEFWMPYYTAV